MGMRTKSIVTAAIAAAGLVSIPMLQADPPAGGFGQCMREGFREHMAQELNLTDTQKSQIEAILKEQEPVVKPLIEQLVKERHALRDVISATPVDEAAIRAQSAKVAAVEANLAVARAQTKARIAPLLTPEQQAKAKELRAKHEERMQRFLNRGGNGGGNS